MTASLLLVSQAEHLNHSRRIKQYALEVQTGFCWGKLHGPEAGTDSEGYGRLGPPSPAVTVSATTSSLGKVSVEVSGAAPGRKFTVPARSTPLLRAISTFRQ
jgi:hypothetical protein